MNTVHSSNLTVLPFVTPAFWAAICLCLPHRDLSNNQLSSFLTNSIIRLRALTTLNVANNLLTGSVPQLIGNMTALQSGSIDISGNRFTSFSPNITCAWAPTGLSCGGNAFGCIGDSGWCLLAKVAPCGVGVCSPPCAPLPLGPAARPATPYVGPFPRPARFD